MKSIPSYLKDTRDTINLLQQVSYSDDLLFATADVAALYTCIPHDLGLSAVEFYLSKSDDIPRIQHEYIMEYLSFATKHNCFWFSNQFYLQQKGVAMGAKFATSLANLFMARWEEEVVYALNRPELVLWARYIDDVFLWKGEKDSLCDFMTILNCNNRGIMLS